MSLILIFKRLDDKIKEFFEKLDLLSKQIRFLIQNWLILEK